MNQVWTEEEKDFIRTYAANMKDIDVAKKLSKITNRKISIDAIRKQRQLLGLTKCNGRGICKLRDKTKK